MSEHKDHIEKLFKEALQSYEVPVGPEVWASIQSALASATAASSASAGSLFLGKAAAVLAITGVITAATIAEVKYHNTEQSSLAVTVVEETSAQEEVENNATFVQSTTSESELNVEQDEKVISDRSNEKQIQKSSEQISTVNAGKRELEFQNTPSTSNEIAGSEKNDTKASVAQMESGTSIESNESSKPTIEKPSREVVVQTQEDQTEEQEPEVSKTTAYFTHDAEQVITPNGDPYNEYFEVDGYGVKDFKMRIMTRGGQTVFESNDIAVRWNGVDRFGNALPAGIYFYEIQAVGDDNLPYLEKNAKGSITIVRN